MYGALESIELKGILLEQTSAFKEKAWVMSLLTDIRESAVR
jgi:hypothetical protein